ncbi:MAG TPA: hypothetical protein VFE37_08165 [Chloroflexota bacterium]|nr:hypothetical protein [Chloroflexota bacterium]
MANPFRLRRAHRAYPRALALALVVLLGLSGTALAQGTPSGDQGPRFGQWGPGRPPPAAEGPTAAPPPGAPAPGTLPQAPAPSAPGAPAPAPAPNYWGGCNWDLRGTWRVTGRQNTPTFRMYRTTAHIQQYGNWLQIEQDDGVSYYGQCNGNGIQLDVYSGDQFIGYQDGSFNYFGGGWDRWNLARIQFSWQTYVPSYAAGNETWHRW